MSDDAQEWAVLAIIVLGLAAVVLIIARVLFALIHFALFL
jgi:hypothetical protein